MYRLSFFFPKAFNLLGLIGVMGPGSSQV